VVICWSGVYYSTVVMLCKHVSQVLSNSSFNAVTGYDDGKKGRRGKRYQTPLPLHIGPFLSFDKFWVCGCVRPWLKLITSMLWTLPDK
jgi:hypothetical protein